MRIVVVVVMCYKHELDNTGGSQKSFVMKTNNNNNNKNHRSRYGVSQPVHYNDHLLSSDIRIFVTGKKRIRVKVCTDM